MIPNTIIAGSLTLTKMSSYWQEKKIEHVIPHEFYRVVSLNYEHDIALVRVKGWLSFTRAVQPICLLSGKTHLNTNKICFISGFGRSPYDGKKSTFLKQAEVKILTREYCNDPPRYNGHIASKMMCSDINSINQFFIYKALNSIAF
nr:PREDICTED: transmembrane protease serine 11D-like [Latimeria chalumnae]|eukprot:XP_014354435.1 PREDICTED: transmembrane protease serine 11D-like [Latimeria chalumnae]